MRSRQMPLGNLNVIGNRIATLRTAKNIKQKDFISQLQAEGMDINPTSFSKLEGQTRQITDIEIIIIAKVLSVRIEGTT